MSRCLLMFIVLFVSSLFADVTATPSTIAKFARESPTRNGLGTQTFTPARVQIVLDTTPSEAWTVSKAGALTTECEDETASCFRIEDTSGNEITNGTGDTTIVLRWRLNAQASLDPGAHTGTITVNPATGSDVVINITLTIVDYEPFADVTYNSGYPLAGCSDPEDFFFNYDAQCPIPDAYPPDTDFDIPDVCESYIDPRFGGTVTRITDLSDHVFHRYSTSSPFSINNTYVMANRPSGEIDIFKVSDCTRTYANVPVVNISKAFWSPITGEDEVIYFFDGGIVKKRVLNTSTTSTVKDMTGAPWNFTSVTDGGTSKPSSNGYLAFWDEGQTEVCALNLATANVYCADYSAIATFTHIDFVEIEYDSVQSKIYVKFIAAPKSPQWEVNIAGGTLDLIGSFDEKIQSSSAALDGDGICETSEDCLGEPHSTLIADAQGRVKMFWAVDEIAGNDTFLATAELSYGASMLRPVEEGGGLSLLQSFNVNTDAHFGASHNGALVVSTYDHDSSLDAKYVFGATAANPSVLTVTSHGYSNGNVVVIGSATGNTCINGLWTIANVTTHTFELVGSTCSGAGSYNSDTGKVALGVAASNGPNRSILMLVVPGTGGYIKPLAQHRTRAYNGGGLTNCCSTNPRAAISMDGSRVLFASNMGVPESASLYMVTTGYSVEEAEISVIINGGVAISGGVIIQ